MATHFQSQAPSVDYFSLTRRTPELRTNNIPPSTIWVESPTSDPALQSPSSDESLAVSPVSPHTLTFSKAGYALPDQQVGIDQKVDPSLLYGSSFEDWMRWDDSIDNTLYPSLSAEHMNLKAEPASPIMDALELSGGLGIPNMSAMMSNGLDDGSVAFQDSNTEEPLFQTPPNIQSQQNDSLYSNTIPWSPSQPRQRGGQTMNTYPPLSTSETSKLMSIAMPKATAETSPISPPQPDNRRKRKSTSSASTSSSSASSNPPPRRQSAPVKKTAHNMIEKRYRTNLNDKIAALRDSVPSLRMTEKNDFNADITLQEDLGGLEAAQKLNKATILSKATEYIAHLEKRNTYLSKECQALKDRVDAFEILLMSQSAPGATNHSQQNHNKARWKQQHTHNAAPSNS